MNGPNRTLAGIGDERNSEATHYRVLGVERDATQAQIRAAYRDAARQAHPDRNRDVGAPSTTMVELNEAYRVLGDPTRRAHYDAQVRSGSKAEPTPENESSAAGSEATVSARPGWLGRLISPPGPARYPVRPVIIAAIVSTLGLLLWSSRQQSSFRVGDTQRSAVSSADAPDGLIKVGSCITIDDQLIADETACTDDGIVVVALVPVDSACPAGQRGYRDRRGMGIACVIEP